MALRSCVGATCVTEAGVAGYDLTDDVALARRARTTLCAAERGRLVVAGGQRGPGAESPVAVFDDGGEALLLVPPGRLVEYTVLHRRHAALLIDADPEFGVGVTLVGRLGEAVFDRRRSGPGAFVASAADDRIPVRLTVERVLVSCPYHEVLVTTPARRAIPLDVYALAEPDRVAVEIARMIPHLNEDHGQDVRAMAAFCSGRPVAEVIGANLDHLCRNGFGLSWVSVGGGDFGGGNQVRYRFGEPARDVDDIGQRLQAFIAGATR